jgi:predicted HTH transcriptional regulator
MDRDEIVSLFRKVYEISYENVEVASIEDIDFNKFRSFTNKVREARSSLIPNNETIVLRNLGLVNDKAKLAAVMLFGKSPQALAPWAVVKIGKFLAEDSRPVF